MNRVPARFKLTLLTILAIAFAIALAKAGHSPVFGMWDGPR